jgi:hypothetical protein
MPSSIGKREPEVTSGVEKVPFSGAVSQKALKEIAGELAKVNVNLTKIFEALGGISANTAGER